MEVSMKDMCGEIANITSTNCSALANITSTNCCVLPLYQNCSEEFPAEICSRVGLICDTEPDLIKGVTIVLVLVLSLIGNVGTIMILSQFKVHKIPDVLVIGLALTDLLATVLPITMAMYAYFAGINYTAGCALCDFFGVLAHFTRYSSSLIVTLVSLERYFAVNRPFIYRKYATPKRFVYILILCWLIALVFGVVPIIGRNTAIVSHDGFCLFDIQGPYAISVLIYSAVQYVTVFLCFVLVTKELIKVYRRRKKLKVQGEYNYNSKARHRLKDRELTFTKPNLTSRISDLGKSIKKAAPILTEKFQLSVEAQFARMLFAVVALFYISWTTIVVVIVIAQASEKISANLEQALFWGIRLSIISTAINPLLYGILARQYRLAYYYVLRLWISKCCYFVNPPLKDVFAAARNLGGDVLANRRGSQQSRYGTQRSVDSSGSMYSRRSNGNVKLTNTTQFGLNIALPSRLSQIHEELSLEPNDSSVAAEFSTHVPTAGELSSSVTIPFQARDHNDSSTVDLEMRGAASMHDLVDAGLVELGITNNPQNGVKNPLAVMTKIIGGEEVLVSPEGSLESDEAHAGFFPSSRAPLFSNPVYGLSNDAHPRTREQIEADITRRETALAASSTDDITLISKKKRAVKKTRSSDVPCGSFAPSHESPVRRGKATNPVALRAERQSHDTTTQEKRLSGNRSIVFPLEVASQRSSALVEATDIDSGESVLVASQDNSDYLFQNQALLASNRNDKASSCSPTHSAKPTPPTMKTIQAHAHSQSFDAAALEPGPQTVKDRNVVNSEMDKRRRDVQKLRNKFANPSPSHGDAGVPKTTRTGHQSVDAGAHQQPKATRIGHQSVDAQQSETTRTGRHNSMENSDSGHESMVLDSENMVQVNVV